MKMAKASEKDMEMALELVKVLESLESGSMPELMQNDPNNIEHVPFDQDSREDCVKAMSHILDVLSKGSIARVVWGMYVLLDPANKVVDPDLDHIDVHPRIKKALALLEALEKSGDNNLDENLQSSGNSANSQEGA